MPAGTCDVQCLHCPHLPSLKWRSLSCVSEMCAGDEHAEYLEGARLDVAAALVLRHSAVICG